MRYTNLRFIIIIIIIIIIMCHRMSPIILLWSIVSPTNCQLWTTLCLMGAEFFRRCIRIHHKT